MMQVFCIIFWIRRICVGRSPATQLPGSATTLTAFPVVIAPSGAVLLCLQFPTIRHEIFCLFHTELPSPDNSYYMPHVVRQNNSLKLTVLRLYPHICFSPIIYCGSYLRHLPTRFIDACIGALLIDACIKAFVIETLISMSLIHF